MKAVRLARHMRAMGWRYGRRRKGEALFGIRFPNGKGVTRVVQLIMLPDLQMSPQQLAAFLTLDAALAAGHDPRARLAT